MIACFEFRQRFGFLTFSSCKRRVHWCKKKKRTFHKERVGKEKNVSVGRDSKLESKATLEIIFHAKTLGNGYYSFLISLSECLMLFVNIGKNMKNCHF